MPAGGRRYVVRRGHRRYRMFPHPAAMRGHRLPKGEGSNHYAVKPPPLQKGRGSEDPRDPAGVWTLFQRRLRARSCPEVQGALPQN